MCLERLSWLWRMGGKWTKPMRQIQLSMSHKLRATQNYFLISHFEALHQNESAEEALSRPDWQRKITAALDPTQPYKPAGYQGLEPQSRPAWISLGVDLQPEFITLSPDLILSLHLSSPFWPPERPLGASLSCAPWTAACLINNFLMRSQPVTAH